MILEELQDQAALYALDALDATETAAFERALHDNAELSALVREMREASADIARTAPAQRPPAELKQRILREVALEKQATATGVARSTSSSASWLPWAIAALVLIFCGVLAKDRARLQRELADARAADALAQTTFVTLTSPTPGHEEAKVTVAWQADRQSGLITINNMAPAGQGRDYQLWAVDANHKDPINAGIIHVDANGVTRVRFKPDQNATQIKAFAISLEREGGVPKREGP
ncbi:MAG: anti-sigma factor, partial [Spartobacteria bacterium]